MIDEWGVASRTVGVGFGPDIPKPDTESFRIFRLGLRPSLAISEKSPLRGSVAPPPGYHASKNTARAVVPQRAELGNSIIFSCRCSCAAQPADPIPPRGGVIFGTAGCTCDFPHADV